MNNLLKVYIMFLLMYILGTGLGISGAIIGLVLSGVFTFLVSRMKKK